MVSVDVKLHQNRAGEVLPRPRLVIAGRDVTEASGGIHEHINPATGLVQVRIPLAGPSEVDKAAAARKAFEVPGPPSNLPKPLGIVISGLESLPPASSSSTLVPGSAERRSASTYPAEPAPTMM